MSFSKPKIPDPLPPPAKRPERQEAVEAEDIQIGGMGDEESPVKGKRALMRPAAGPSGMGGVGLAV